MATTTLLNLPVVTGLTGDESLWLVQAGTDKRTTLNAVGQLATFVATTSGLGLFETEVAAAAANIGSNIAVVFTSGYSTIGDSGGGTYKRVSSQPTLAGKFQSADGTWWELLPEPIMRPQQFAAVTGGVTDDTTALQGALDFAAANGVTLFLNGKSYLTDSLLLPDGTVFVGPGTLQQVAIPAADTSVLLMRGVGTRSDITIRDMTLTGSYHAVNNPNGSVVVIEDGTDVTVDGCTITNSKNGVLLVNGHTNTIIRGNQFTDLFNGVTSIGTTGTVLNLQIVGNAITAPGRAGSFGIFLGVLLPALACPTYATLEITDNDVFDVGGGGIWLSLLPDSGGPLFLTGNHLSAIGNDCLDVEGFFRALISNNLIENVGTGGSGPGGGGAGILLGDMNYFSVNDNTVMDTGDYGIVTSGNCHYGLVANNVVGRTNQFGGTAAALQVAVAPGSTINSRITFEGNVIFDDAGSPTSAYGFGMFNAADGENILVVNNRIDPTMTVSAMNLPASVAGLIIEGNTGYNPTVAAAVTPGVSPYTYTAGYSPETIILSATSISSATIGGVSVLPVATAGPLTYDLSPNQSITLAYTGALVFKKIPH